MSDTGPYEPPSILWSPCCNIIRETDNPGVVHCGLCRRRHGGMLGPTVRLTVHPDDLAMLRTWRAYQHPEADRG